MSPGMETAYLNYIAADRKREQEGLKNEGQILQGVTNRRSRPDRLEPELMTEYKDMATMEATPRRTPSFKVYRLMKNKGKSYRERLEIRKSWRTGLPEK